MNVPGMIKRLKGKSYPVTRMVTDGEYNATTGVYDGGAISTLSILGSVQPIGAQDLVSIPEGDRTKERKRFYSFPELKNNDTGALRKGDLVSVDAVDFQVESVEHWPGYSKSILVRVNTDAN